MKYVYHCMYGLLFCLIVAGGCKKVKEDLFFDRKDILNSPASSIRIFNFSNGFLNISVNNLQLTSFVSETDATLGTPATTGTQLGLSFFPEGVWRSGRDGSPFTIPGGLLDKSNKARINVVAGFLGTPKFIPNVHIDTVLQNDPLHPMDYFILSDGHLLALARSAAAPVAPDHFKLRVLNLGIANDTLGLDGPVTVTLADGTTAAPQLTNVLPGKASDYAELPYGSYQFKLFVNGDFTKQLAELPIYPFFDVCSGARLPQTRIFPAIKTFKPGGTYSIIITRNFFAYIDCVIPELAQIIPVNAYRIITENSPPLNISYARAAGINSLTDQPVVFKVDGKEMGQTLPSGTSTEPSILITGTHTLSAYDGAGKLLAERSYYFSAADYISVWVYAHAGKHELVFTSNDLTLSHYIGSPLGDDGTNGNNNVITFDHAWQSRFLNLSDIPYVTFTNQDGESFQSISGGGNGGDPDTLSPANNHQNLQPGVPVEHEPFVIIQCVNHSEGQGASPVQTESVPPVFYQMPSQIRVFQSTPGPLGETPGNWLSGIAPLKSEDFIVNPSLYQAGPVETETGSYSIALIGSQQGSGAQKARLIFIKHNK